MLTSWSIARLSQTMMLSSGAEPNSLLLQRDVLFDHTLRDRCDPDGIGLDAGLDLQLEEGAGRDREHHDRQHRSRKEGEKQLSVKACANLPQQRSPRRRSSAAERRNGPREHQHRHVGEADKRRELRKVDEVIECA